MQAGLPLGRDLRTYTNLLTFPSELVFLDSPSWATICVDGCGDGFRSDVLGNENGVLAGCPL